MKNLFCHLAQRNSSPTGAFAKHVASCRKCEGFFEQVSSLESRLATSAGEPNLDLCAGILSKIASEEPSPIIKLDRRWVYTPMILTSAAAVILALVAFVTVHTSKKPDVSADVPVERVAEPQITGSSVPREMTLSYAMQQQELLQRDALKLGTHLRENFILFRAGD